MTRAEYEAYQAAVEAFFEREGLSTLSTGSIEHDYNEDGDPFFSWYRCDCCDRPRGGERETCIGYNPTTKEVQGDYALCLDCVYYNEYGQLDDMTMLELTE